MIVLIVSAALVVVGLALALAFGRAGRMSVHAAEPVSTAGGFPLPPGEVTAENIAATRFDTAFRGYRMDQVDAVLDRLQARLAELEPSEAPRLTAAPPYVVDEGPTGAYGGLTDDGADPEDDDAVPVAEGAPWRGVPSAETGSLAAFPVIRRHTELGNPDDALHDGHGHDGHDGHDGRGHDDDGPPSSR